MESHEKLDVVVTTIIQVSRLYVNLSVVIIEIDEGWSVGQSLSIAILVDRKSVVHLTAGWVISTGQVLTFALEIDKVWQNHLDCLTVVNDICLTVQWLEIGSLHDVVLLTERNCGDYEHNLVIEFDKSILGGMLDVSTELISAKHILVSIEGESLQLVWLSDIDHIAWHCAPDIHSIKEEFIPRCSDASASISITEVVGSLDVEIWHSEGQWVVQAWHKLKLWAIYGSCIALHVNWISTIDLIGDHEGRVVHV